MKEIVSSIYFTSHMRSFREGNVFSHVCPHVNTTNRTPPQYMEMLLLGPVSVQLFDIKLYSETYFVQLIMYNLILSIGYLACKEFKSF